MKVLLIDDDKTCLKSIGKALAINGIPNNQFVNAAEAISNFKKEHYDVVVTDMKMPEMTGLDVLKEIRAIDSTASVVILTAFYDENKEKKALELGAYSFLHKSVKFEDFLGTLKEIEKSLKSRKGKAV